MILDHEQHVESYYAHVGTILSCSGGDRAGEPDRSRIHVELPPRVDR